MSFTYLNNMMARKPRWEHDCFDCTWLGPFEGADLYACITGFGPDNLEIKTVIARTGIDGEYVSGLEFINRDKRLGTAYVRAQEYILQVRYNALMTPPPGTPDAIELEAFNLWEGATFMHHGSVWIIHELRDFGASERILAVAHRGDRENNRDFDLPFVFDYMDTVSVIGNVRNPKDYDDNNWGAR
jgi:hypothetical protein